VTRYGYLDQYGHESPYLRVHPGDRLILPLKNGLPAAAENDAMAMSSTSGAAAELCAGASMTATSTHFHFHGLALPPAMPSGRCPTHFDCFRGSTV
jgi:FtsP/CotA-like multicopper oxidase with cupredoxin domain